MNFKRNNKKYILENTHKQTKQEDNFEDDYVAKSIGAFGLWQLMYTAISTADELMPCWNSISIIFLAPATDFVCKTFRDNITLEASNNTCYDNCVEYEFVRNIFEETLITEFSLICGDAWLASFTQTMMMFGIICGVSFYGWISDRFGRSKAIVLCSINSIVFMFAQPFCPFYWLVTVVRFFIGFGSGGIISLSPVYNSEIVGAKYLHTVLLATVATIDGIGFILLAAFAYWMTSWRLFIIVYSSVALLPVILTFFLPETPRWLIAKNKVEDAVDLLTKAAKFNGMDTSNIIEDVTKITQQTNQKNPNLTYFDLFRTRKLAIWTIASLVIWIAAGFSYYGLVQYISQFGSNIYIVVSVLGLFHIIVSPINIAILKYCGRKRTCIYTYIIIGIASIALIFTPKESTVGFVLGSFGLTAVIVVYSVIYVYVVELYPTSVRNMGLGLVSVGSKGVAMLAPFVVNMMKPEVASSIFAATSFAAALFCLLLPETKGKSLKDTIKDDYQ